MIQGSCQCGGVRFTVESVHPVGLKCYCEWCRRISGGPFAPVVMAPRGSLKILAGAELVVRYNASPHYDRSHCSRCHAPVFGESSTMPELPLYVPAGALDAAAIAGVVFDHMFVRSRATWYRITDDRPQYDTYPPTPLPPR